MLINLSLATILSICVWTDVKSRKIYNVVLLPALLIAFIIHFYLSGWTGLSHALLGFFVGLLILFIPYCLGGIGAGDVKLLAVVGAWKGALFVLYASIYMALFGAILAVGIILFRRGFFKRITYAGYVLAGLKSGVRVPFQWKSPALKLTYPYGVAIAAGVLVAMVLEGGLG